MKSRYRFIIVLALFAVFLFMLLAVCRIIENKKIPYIAFMQNFDKETCFYICSDGKIYASTSEESFHLTSSELIERVQRDDYSDMLELVGRTSGMQVREMYRLFSDVVLDDEYRLRRKHLTVIDSYAYEGDFKGESYEDKVWYWYGIYYNEKGEADSRCFYQSLSDMVCSDKRAYKIVGWMYDTLKSYIY